MSRKIQSHLGFLIILAVCTTFCISGCAEHYDRINFCWTSNHRIPPDERIISVSASPQAVKNALATWTLDNNGEILTETHDYNKILTLHPDSSKNFEIAHEYAEKKWSSYEKNIYSKDKEGVWQRFVQASKTQVTEKPSSEQGYKLTVKVGDRNENIQIKVKTGHDTIYAPGQTMVLSSGTVVTTPPTPISTPHYEYKKKTLTFYSKVLFFIFKNEGKTQIYAYALPVEGKIEAKYGNSIGQKWHSYIDARVEAIFVKDAFGFLENLDHSGKLQEFENN